MVLFLLYESTSCYALFKVHDDEKLFIDFNIVKLHSFHPFTSSFDAMKQWSAFSSGIMTDELRAILKNNLPKVKKGKKVKFNLGVSNPKVGLQISKVTKIPFMCDEFTHELLRYVKIHFDRFVHDLKFVDFEYSLKLANLEYQFKSVDNMVIREIIHLTTLDKDVISIFMKFREWYSQFFPELAKIINDNHLYAKVAKFIEDKSKLSDDKISDLANIVGDEDKAKEIMEAAKASKGRDLSQPGLISLQVFAETAMNLIEERRNLYNYLVAKRNG